MMKIIITGSLGNISKPLAQEQIAKGHDITIISTKAVYYGDSDHPISGQIDPGVS
jgi:nucleoside-diphosphate-sugar epimerase